MRDQIQRNNTIIDPSKGTDLATAISKYTSGGVQLADAIGELAKSLTILFQDQMGYSTFTKRYNSCKFDLYRECFYFVGHDKMTGDPIQHVIHEWQTAGIDFTFADGESTYTASRPELRQFANDLPGFLEKLQDDLMSSAAESEGKASNIGCLADRLRECNLIILKRIQDRPDRGPFFPEPEQVTEDNQVEPFLEAAMNAIHKIDEADQSLTKPCSDRHTEYAKVLWSELRNAYRRGVFHSAAAQAMLDGQEGPPED